MQIITKGSDQVEEIHKQAESDYMSGMKYKDIADKYGVSLNTVKSWKKRYGWNRGAPKRKKVQKEGAHKENDISWIDIENEYVTDIRKKPISLEELSDKYSIPIQTVKDQSAKGKWSDKRTKYKRDTNQKAIDKSSDKDADRIARLIKISDKAADKAEQALEELQQYVVYNKQKTRVIEYKDNTAIGKPTKEVIDEKESVQTEIGPIDRQGLQQITTALKNLKDIFIVPDNRADQKHTEDMDKRKIELELLRIEMQQKDTQEPEQQVQDNFLDALNASAQEVWKDGE